MKKILMITLIVAGFALNIKAQEMEIGGGIAYGTNIQKVGLNLKLNYGLLEKMYISAYANFFMPEKIEVNAVEACSALTTGNLDFHYRIINNEKFKLYPFAGVNYSRIGVINGGVEQDPVTSIGANVGAGFKWKSIFTELMYSTGNEDISQLTLTLGFLF